MMYVAQQPAVFLLGASYMDRTRMDHVLMPEPAIIKIRFTRSRQEYHDILTECKLSRARTTCKWSPSSFI